MPENVFVLGVDEHNERILRELPDAGQYRFHPLLSYEEIYGEEIRLGALLDKAQRELESFDGRVDAIIGFWDFPISTLLPILRAWHGLPGPPLEEIVKCEHKYWSRLEQQKVIDEYPRFGLVDPEHDQHPPDGVNYPLWVKPVKSFSSMLAFGVTNQEEFRDALTQIRAGISWVGEPFDALLEYVDLPPEIATVGGHFCLAEEAITGQQVTLEGYRYQGEVHIYGVVDSVRYENSPSFLRYQYPSSLPTEVSLRMAEIAHEVIMGVGLDGATFNIEFFWEPDGDTITLLEVNPRHSQSHAELFEQVDGTSSHQVMLRLALGRDPDMPRRQGPYPVAAKWFLRRFSDGFVRHTPTTEEIDRVQREIPGSSVEVSVQAGDRLAELHRQDAYSYRLASVWIGGADEAELTTKFAQVAVALPFQIDNIDDEQPR
ncbi:MAG: ATP-grasp domain-containing protein [Pseudonocardiaceae bacterium]|nr:ATP-grasp domain-containing protein [Pseudonocardiaceae bacterium]